MSIYQIERGNGRVIVKFKNRPPKKTVIMLESLGFRYYPRWRCWIGRENGDFVEEALKRREKEARLKKDQFEKRSTLCWKCKNACGGCEWSKSGKPVVGWTAEHTTIFIRRTRGKNSKVNYIQSFRVIDCPEYIFG